MRKNRIFIIAGMLAVTIFVAGVIQLLLLRFSSGDVYPPYSSLRGDPLGSKALYESLDECCGLRVARNYEAFEMLKDRSESVVMIAGAYPPFQDLMPVAFMEDVEFFLRNGGRMVVAYAVPEETDIEKTRKEVEEQKKRESKEKKKEPQKEKKENLKWVSFSARWGLQYRQYPLEGATEARVTVDDASAGLPPVVFWHSTLYFDQLDPEWRVLYRREGRAVLIERQMGKGSVVLSADSYFLSNEAMLRHRYPGLLAWLVGNKNSVIFDEYFHGIAASPGVASLARRYHLHGLVAGILILAALFVWKNSMSFVPPHPDTPESKGKAAEGKDSTAGLTNLLRRSIPARDILAVCWQEWKKSSAPTASRTQHQQERIESTYHAERAASLRHRNPVQTYNRISTILKER